MIRKPNCKTLVTAPHFLADMNSNISFIIMVYIRHYLQTHLTEQFGLFGKNEVEGKVQSSFVSQEEKSILTFALFWNMNFIQIFIYSFHSMDDGKTKKKKSATAENLFADLTNFFFLISIVRPSITESGITGLYFKNPNKNIEIIFI